MASDLANNEIVLIILCLFLPPLAIYLKAGDCETHCCINICLMFLFGIPAVVNIGTTRLAFKVKSSNNSAYRLKPVFGFVDAGAATEMEITRLRGPPKEDKLVIQYAEVPADATDAQATFKPGTTANEVVIRVTAK